MTKRLILTRHAKSSWDDPNTLDHGRPLNARGKAAAADLGSWLFSRDYTPSEVLCSDAVRTSETWSCIMPSLPPTALLNIKPALYNAGPDVVLAVLRRASANVVMIIGHNPGMAEFASRIVLNAPLNHAFSNYPTGATLVCDFNVDAWSDISYGMGNYLDFIVPREIEL
ncbi:MAG: histidine phosphatase family protein [Paracoccaceae bacterium]|jgi:phosphohistidine phosphatase